MSAVRIGYGSDANGWQPVISVTPCAALVRYGHRNEYLQLSESPSDKVLITLAGRLA
jgi:hypothetical protein